MALPSAGPTDCSSGLSARIFNNFRYDNPWQASQGGVAVGTLVCPTTPNGFGYRCSAITTGITGGGEPTWPIVLTNTVVDGGVTWTCQDVANPTGKAHPPVGYFGYVFTSNDLDGFRLLAYNVARGVADDIGGGSDYCAAAGSTAAGQALGTSSTYITIVYGTEEKDTDGTYDNATGIFTVPAGKGGDYQIVASMDLALALTGVAALAIQKNGAGTIRECQVTNPGAGQTLEVNALLNLAAADTIRFLGWQNAGGSRNLGATAAHNYFALSRILGS